MADLYIDLMDGPDIDFDVVEFNSEFVMLNDRGDKSSSSVWKHFGSIKYRDAIDKKHVYCISCFYNQKIKKYQRSTSTGNLSKHLQVHHNISLCETFRVKKEHDNSLQLIRRETDEAATEGKDDENQEEQEEFLIHDINEILISEVAKRPLLYRSQTQLEGNGAKTSMRRQLWNEVYVSLNQIVPLPRLPTIWKNIRDRYHKVRRIASGDGLKPKYRYYDQLRFLDPEADETQPTNSKASATSAKTTSNVEQVEFILSGDHHYVSTKPMPIPSEEVTYEEISYEPKAKKQKAASNKAASQLVTRTIAIKPKPSSKATVVTRPSNIIEESFVNATTSDIYTAFAEELETEEAELHDNSHALLNHGSIEVISTPQSNSTMVEKKSDEFEIFGHFVAEVMRNMPKSQSRLLQMNIMKVIAESEDQSR